MMKKEFVLVFAFLLVVSMISFTVYAQDEISLIHQFIDSSVNTQTVSPDFASIWKFFSPKTYFPEYGDDTCQEKRDLNIQISPEGCSPLSVRSDLLEEQNVPVFCKIIAVKTNPLVEKAEIKAVRFKGAYPDGVSGVSYFPTRDSLKYQESFVNPPADGDLGYISVVLGKQEIEGDMPEAIQGEITVVVDYDIEEGFGVGESAFYLSETNNWNQEYQKYNLWNKAYLRADSIYSDSAVVSLYGDSSSIIASVNLKLGEVSKDIYLDDYCALGLNLKLEDIAAPSETALLQINDKQVWVSKGDKILDKKCRVTNLDSNIGGGKLGISCPIDDGNFELVLSPGKALFEVDGELEEHTISDRVGKENVYLGYIGVDKKNNRFAILVRDEFSETQVQFANKKVYEFVEGLEINNAKAAEAELKRAIENYYQIQLSNTAKRAIVQDLDVRILIESETGFNAKLKEVLIGDDVITFDEGGEFTTNYYEKSIDYYEELADLYPNEKMKFLETDPYAASGLLEGMMLAREFGMNEKVVELADRLIELYPKSNSAVLARQFRDVSTKYNTDNSRKVISAGANKYIIDLLEFRKPSRSEASVVLNIGDEQKVLGLEEATSFRSGETINKLEVKTIGDDYVILKLSGQGSETVKLNINGEKSSTKFADIEIGLVDINLARQIKVFVSPKRYGTKTESVIDFKVDIEKRAIRLSPEQTMSVMNELIQKINFWNSVNKNLEIIIGNLKQACFATSTILGLKYSSGDVTSISRTNVMGGDDGWNAKCEKLVKDGEYDNIEICLLERATEIEKDVDILAGSKEQTNKVVEDIKKDIKDPAQAEEEFKRRFEEECKNLDGGVVLPDKNKVSFGGDKGICNWDKLTYGQRKDILTLARVRNSGSEVLKNKVDTKLGKVVADAKDKQGIDINVDSEKLVSLQKNELESKSGISYKGGESRCTDFMSAKDCNLLFNLCDPVVCPPSRCDLGGKLRVKNVVETGIVGSMLLCLPNAKEGIAIPVCLTGIQAGLQGYLSILNATASCLEESLETGKTVGICDEIKGAYMCEFFFQQSSTFMNSMVPSFINTLETGKGGGEYRNINSAWQSTSSSMDYITQTYGSAAQSSFNSRSLIGDVGTGLCKSFESKTSVGLNTLFDQASKLESPPQYTGWFDEVSLTSATTTPTSHYKVYYHIYAGENKPASYRVYLKDFSGNVYEGYGVDRGHLPKGGQVDESKDFIAPSGYRQLCIEVNDKQECGFTQVGIKDYGINLLNKRFVEDLSNVKVDSAAECVSDSSSGIIRICSREDPGKQVGESINKEDDKGEDKDTVVDSRWVEIGTCEGDLKCWLDSNSVKKALEGEDVENIPISHVDLGIFDVADYLSEEFSRSMIEESEDSISDLRIYGQDNEASIDSKVKQTVEDLVEVSERGTTNNYRAWALYLLGRLFKKVTEGLLVVGSSNVIHYPGFDNIIEADIVEIEEPDRAEELERCVSYGFWADESLEAIPDDSEIRPGRIYLGLVIPDIDVCDESVRVSIDGEWSGNEIPIDSSPWKQIGGRRDRYYYAIDVSDSGVFKSGKYNFRVEDSGGRVVFNGYNINVESVFLIDLG